ncbi:MAG: hypothetical protein CFH01_00458 [Alphaproteobacteria bacterium MarineAlpha2_Bin1]|nr:MAG: hypothetical protein CFH01_00458 [Alphaproteobacteria bacterium MarineAlpha2_Bin1]|tara:strand:+ start:1812 stop:3011 length:1200 start_codon:yes stop_codon:yes gene_type:complete
MKNLNSFEDLIDPIKEKKFFDEFHDNRFLHIKANNSDKFLNIFNWESFSRILNMTSIWTSSSLQLVLDKNKIAPEDYCFPGVDREGNEVFQPQPNKLIEFLNKGATLIANEVDTLDSNIDSIAKILEDKFSSKTQCNIYFSKQGRQGFDIHFDVHEVFAINLIGEKVWNIYEGRLDNPINSEAFISLDKEYAKENCGKILEKVLLKPGDILYIPRGQFHEALASSDRSMHLSFSVTHLIGHDVLSLLFNEAMSGSFFRSNLPMTFQGPKEIENWINKFNQNLSNIIKSSSFSDIIKYQVANYKLTRGTYSFPDDLTYNLKQKFIFKENVILKNVGSKIILEVNKKGITIPNKYIDIIKKLISIGSFTIEEAQKKSDNLDLDSVRQLIDDLSNMSLIRKQ